MSACSPRNMPTTKVSDLADEDRELYNWMKSKEGTIPNMHVLVRNFMNACAVGGQQKDAFTFQAKATRKLAESVKVLAVEESDGRGKDVDIRLEGDLNIQVWHGKYDPDYDSNLAEDWGSRVYNPSELEAAAKPKLDQLPEGKKGFVVNLVPGYTGGGPPAGSLTADKCLISSNDCKHAVIYRTPDFKHIEDARDICGYLDWKVPATKERAGYTGHVVDVREEKIAIDATVEVMVTRAKTGQQIRIPPDMGSQKPASAPEDDSWCGCR